MIGISERGKLGTRRRLQASDVVDGNTFARARQIIDGKDPMSMPKIHKPLSIAVDELNKGLLKIMPETAEEEAEEMEAKLAMDLKTEPGMIETVANEAAEETVEE